MCPSGCKVYFVRNFFLYQLLFDISLKFIFTEIYIQNIEYREIFKVIEPVHGRSQSRIAPGPSTGNDNQPEIRASYVVDGNVPVETQPQQNNIMYIRQNTYSG